MSLLNSVVSLLYFATGDIHIENNIYENLASIKTPTYYEFEIKNGKIYNINLILQKPTYSLPSFSKKYYMEYSSKTNAIYDIASEVGNISQLYVIKKFFTDNIKDGKGIDDLEVTSTILIHGCDAYAMLNPLYKSNCSFLRHLFKKYIQYLDDKTLEYMKDVLEKGVNMLQNASVTIVMSNNASIPSTVTLDINKSEYFVPFYLSVIKNIKPKDDLHLNGDINMAGYILHKSQNKDMLNRFHLHDTFTFNTAINVFNTSILHFASTNVIADIKNTFALLQSYDKIHPEAIHGANTSNIPHLSMHLPSMHLPSMHFSKFWGGNNDINFKKYLKYKRKYLKLKKKLILNK